jgi:basic membrane protein A
MRLIPLVALLFGCLGLNLAHAADREIKVGFVYVSPVGDAGWSRAHDQARQAVDALPGVSTSFVEAVAEGPDSERVIQTMARKKYDLIFATSFGYMDSMLKVAGQFPNTVFMHCSGLKTAANMGTILAGSTNRVTSRAWSRDR